MDVICIFFSYGTPCIWRSEDSFAESLLRHGLPWLPPWCVLQPRRPSACSWLSCLCPHLSAGVLGCSCAPPFGVSNQFGTRPSYCVCTDSAFYLWAHRDPEFWLFFNMALFSLFVGPFISYLFDDTVFNVVTPSGSLPWLFPSTSSLGWVLGFLSHGRLPGGMSVVLTHFLSSSLGLISWGQDPCPISFPTRRSTGNTLLN